MVQATELCFRAGRWLTPRWAAEEHIQQINTRMNSLRVEFQGCSSWSSCRPSHPSITGKQITPLSPFTGKSWGLKVDKQLLWMWDSQLQLAVSTVGYRYWPLALVAAVPSLLLARTQLWVSRELGICHKSAPLNFQQQLRTSRISWDIPSTKEGNRGQASNFPKQHPLVKRSVLSYLIKAVLSADILKNTTNLHFCLCKLTLT